VRATVNLATHDHGPLIAYSVGSALAQTERDLEVLIVGDGVPDAVRPEVERVVASDPRVRFLDLPKGAGHGFRHRDQAIHEAKSDNILYLSDDDIWLPDHAALLCAALEEADFVASLGFGVGRDNVRLKAPHDLANPRWRMHLVEERSMLSLSLIGHSRALYSRLETGWRRDDTYYRGVWRDFALHAERMATVPRVTAVVIPDLQRADMSDSDRLAELAELAELVSDPAGRLELLERLLENEVGRWSRDTIKLERLQASAKGAREARRDA
jgi:GalNAc5-diNAcBac-PP-undecaprenol beta-1,3-glucosyltransferase